MTVETTQTEAAFVPKSEDDTHPVPTTAEDGTTNNDNDTTTTTTTTDHAMPDAPPASNTAGTNDDPLTTATDTDTDTNTDIPLTSTLRTHPKRLLPQTLSSTYPHGHISGHPRTTAQQSALETRRGEILRTMTAQEIERAYEEVAGKVRQEIEDGERVGREVEEKMERLRMEREMERRVWGKLRGMKGGD